MQATSNAGSLQGLLAGVAGTRLHQTGHLILGELDLAATKGRERDVSDLEGVCGLARHDCECGKKEEWVSVGREGREGVRWRTEGGKKGL